MRGNVEQRGDNRWRLRVFAGRDNGRPTFVTRSFQGTKRQAETALAKLVTEVEQGQVAKHHPGTLADLLDQWLEAVAPERSAYTMKEYRRMAAMNIKPAIGTVPLPKLTGARLDTFYRSLTNRGDVALLVGLFGEPAKPETMSEVAGVERVRVERAAHPFEHRVVLGMRGIVDHGKEVGVAPDASAVFGGTGPSSCGAGWVGRTGYRSDDLLDYQLVFPVIAEVVDVTERRPFLGDAPTEPGARFWATGPSPRRRRCRSGHRRSRTRGDGSPTSRRRPAGLRGARTG